MDEMNANPTNDTPKKEGKVRRDMIKGLLSIPFLGAFGLSFWQEWKASKGNTVPEPTGKLGISDDAYPMPPVIDGNKIRLGIIGYGRRGEELLRAAGFAHPQWVDGMKQAQKENKDDPRLDAFDTQQQPLLNVEITGVCDVYDTNAMRGIEASGNHKRKGSRGKMGKKANRYKINKDLIL